MLTNMMNKERRDPGSRTGRARKATTVLRVNFTEGIEKSRERGRHAQTEMERGGAAARVCLQFIYLVARLVRRGVGDKRVLR